MTLSIFLAGLFLITCSKNSFCQEAKLFKRILADKRIGKVYKTASANDTTWLTYLGTLDDNENQIEYYVIKEFNKIRAASTWHGHSTIYFYDARRKRAAFVHVAMPNDLPYKLDRNTFYFRYTESGVTRSYSKKMQTPLQKVFCSREDDCYDIIFD